MNRWLSKLASTFILALLGKKLTPLNSLTNVLFYTNFPKDFGEAKQNCPKCLHFTVEYLTCLFIRLGLSNPIESVPFKAS